MEENRWHKILKVWSVGTLVPCSEMPVGLGVDSGFCVPFRPYNITCVITLGQTLFTVLEAEWLQNEIFFFIFKIEV